MKQSHAIALFELAGFEVKSIHELPNGYWPDAYVELRKEFPWWLIETQFGLIKIGWRKRVISINWGSTKTRVIVTEDDVTKDSDLVHAYGYVKALEYLARLKQACVLDASLSPKPPADRETT
jgi:hypothetical protein